MADNTVLWPLRQASREAAAVTQRGAAISNRYFYATMAALFVLAAVPFVLGSVMNARRIRAARLDTPRLAAALTGLGRQATPDARVLVGRGKVPIDASPPGWFQGTSQSLDRELAERDVTLPTTDPWLQAYLVNIGARGPRWVISAGPNGILETGFENIRAPGGDDIGSPIE